MICLQTGKHFRSSILSEITWSVLSIFFSLIRIRREPMCQLRKYFVIYSRIQFQKWLGFDVFVKLLIWRQSKIWSKIWQYVAVSKVSVVLKDWRVLHVVSFKTSPTNFIVNMEQQLRHTRWLVTFGSNFDRPSKFSLQ